MAVGDGHHWLDGLEPEAVAAFERWIGDWHPATDDFDLLLVFASVRRSGCDCPDLEVVRNPDCEWDGSGQPFIVVHDGPGCPLIRRSHAHDN